MARHRIRIRFRKAGELRFISHHDLMRCFERMLRRAQLPFDSTQGFNPKPRLTFALSLPLGVIGCEEIVDLELDREVPPSEIHRQLSQQAPAGLEISDVQFIPPTSSVNVQRICYRIALPPGEAEPIARRIKTILNSDQCWTDRTRPRPKHIDLRPFIHDMRIVSDTLKMELVLTPQGTARPQEVLALLGITDLLEKGCVLERFGLELQNRDPVDSLANLVEGDASSL